MVAGADVAPVLRFVQRALGSRGYREPLETALPFLTPRERAEVTLRLVNDRKLDERTLARLSVALTALENYYRAIGARSDARRMGEMRIPVDIVLDRFRVEHEREARCRHADMWQRAFAQAVWRA